MGKTWAASRTVVATTLDPQCFKVPQFYAPCPLFFHAQVLCTRSSHPYHLVHVHILIRFRWPARWPFKQDVLACLLTQSFIHSTEKKKSYACTYIYLYIKILAKWWMLYWHCLLQKKRGCPPSSGGSCFLFLLRTSPERKMCQGLV